MIPKAREALEAALAYLRDVAEGREGCRVLLLIREALAESASEPVCVCGSATCEGTHAEGWEPGVVLTDREPSRSRR